jgi:hypothetical protein
MPITCAYLIKEDKGEKSDYTRFWLRALMDFVSPFK